MKTLRLICVLALSLPLTAQQPARPAITGIAFARFYTTDTAGAEKFYGDTLGFGRIAGNGNLLYPVNHSQWIELLTAPPPQPNVRMAAVGFTTRDITALDRYLRARSVKLEQPLRDKRLAVRDPEGNLVYFVQSGAEKAVATAAVSPKASSTRLIHAGFMVHDAEKENTFWKEILGFRPLWHGGRTEAETDWISLQVPDGTDWVEYMLNAPPQPTLKQAGGMYHISLGTPHMQEVVDALARNHCEGASCTAMKLGRDGKMQLNLFDPDQTRVEFMEFKPTQEPCCSPFTGKFPGAEEDQ